MVIIRNMAKCAKCGEVIESKSRHDMVWCPCGAIAVDGGHDYLKRSMSVGEDCLIELSEYSDKEKVDRHG